MMDFEKLVGNRVKNNNYIFFSGLNTQIKSETFNGCSLKRTQLRSSKIEKSQFFECAFTGSRFQDTSFQSSSFQYVNFQFSTFTNCNFLNLKEDENLHGNNFDHCYFYKVHFKSVEFHGCSMSCTNFIECTFEDCSFYATTLECTVFKHCELIDINMSELNIEYSQFLDCDFNKVLLPFTQIAYIIGFSEFNSKTNINISTEQTQLEFIQYIAYFHDLCSYYERLNERFPIVNILLFQNKIDEAFEMIKEEINRCLIKSDYRMIKHLCRLATHNNSFLPTNVTELFSLVKQHLGSISGERQTLECLNNIDEIRRLTMEAKYNKTALKIIIETNIDSCDMNSVKSLIETIENTVTNVLPNCYSKSIEIRHNSPYELFLQLCQNAKQIEQVAKAIVDALPILEMSLSVVCSSLALRERIKKHCTKNKKNMGNITKVTIIIE